MKRFFDSELDTLQADLVRMGGLVIDRLKDVLKAYQDCDVDLANSVIESDRKLDELEVSIDEEAIRYLTLRSPVATQLRVLVIGMKTSHEFERAGDEITKIARRVRSLFSDAPIKTNVDLVEMGLLTCGMLRDAIDCFFEGTEAKALNVCQRDGKIDEMNRMLQDELTTRMAEDSSIVARAVDLIFISKAIERIADHATNIAEETIYVLNAKDVRHTPEVKSTPPSAETA